MIVPLYGQKYNMSCWAASMRMILASRMRMVASDDDIAAPLNYRSSLMSGLNPNDTRILRHWGFEMLAPQCYTSEGFADVVMRHAPLWVACDVRSPGASRAIPHIRVVTGLRALSSPLYLRVNDPGPVRQGSSYEESFTDFMAKNELLGSTELREPAPVYVAYLR